MKAVLCTECENCPAVELSDKGVKIGGHCARLDAFDQPAVRRFRRDCHRLNLRTWWPDAHRSHQARVIPVEHTTDLQIDSLPLFIWIPPPDTVHHR